MNCLCKPTYILSTLLSTEVKSLIWLYFSTFAALKIQFLKYGLKKSAERLVSYLDRDITFLLKFHRTALAHCISWPWQQTWPSTFHVNCCQIQALPKLHNWFFKLLPLLSLSSLFQPHLRPLIRLSKFLSIYVFSLYVYYI